MLYAITRANGTVAITTLMPNALITDKGAMQVTGADGIGKKLLLRDPTLTAEQEPSSQEISFTVDFRDLDVDSLSEGTLVFPKIEDEIKKMPNPDEYVSFARITTKDLPAVRTFRNAWTHNGTTLAVDMAMARDIRRDKLREERKPMLETLDIAYQRADEQDDGPTKRRIAAEKQKLRDITANPLIEQAATPEALDLLTVEYLLAHP